MICEHYRHGEQRDRETESPVEIEILIDIKIRKDKHDTKGQRQGRKTQERKGQRQKARNGDTETKRQEAPDRGKQYSNRVH